MAIKKKSDFTGKQKTARRRGFFSFFWASQIVVLLLALIFLILVMVPLLKNYAKQRLITSELQELQAEISDFESKNQDLSAMLEYLQSDDSLEEQARINLGLKKPGEKVIVIQIASSSPSDGKEEKDSISSNFLKWWRYFFAS